MKGAADYSGSCNRQTAIETDISAGDSPQERLDERIDGLSRLTGEIGKSGLQRGIHGDRGVWHESIVPRAASIAWPTVPELFQNPIRLTGLGMLFERRADAPSRWKQ